jgi:hypothetical protein
MILDNIPRFWYWSLNIKKFYEGNFKLHDIMLDQAT